MPAADPAPTPRASPGGPITIVLADDHQVIRQGLRALLDAAPGLSVVGEAADGAEALGLVERLSPGVLVVDVMMPGLGGLEVTRRVRQRVPRTQVVVLSMYANEAYVLEALRNGACGYVLKEASAAELVHAVRGAAQGRRYLSPPLSEQAIDVYAERTRAGTVDPYETLTPREREILYLAARGVSNPEIAARLAISARTVETHRARVLQKLGLQGQTDLVRYAMRRGILPAEDDAGGRVGTPASHGPAPRPSGSPASGSSA
jgi:two-component system, NarL family, response regulator NreC